jgi:immune inhibitor A
MGLKTGWNNGMRGAFVTLACLLLAGGTLRWLAPEVGSRNSAEPTAGRTFDERPNLGAGPKAAQTSKLRRAAIPQRPPARFRPPADGGQAPLTIGIHNAHPGPDGESIQIARPPSLAAAGLESRLLERELVLLKGRAEAGPEQSSDPKSNSSADEGRASEGPAPSARASTNQQSTSNPITATILVLPIEYAGSASLDYQIHTPDLSECITVTGHFTGPLHGAIPYPGGSPETGIDNQTVYYPSTEPADYAQLIFGHRGYTEPIRAGDPNINAGAGVDISGLTVENYFRDQSDGRVVITGTVAPWVALDRPEAYYGLDQCVPEYSSRAIPDEQLGSLAEMTVSAAEKLKTLDPAFAEYEFWKNLDDDGDGIVDSLWVMHAGRGQEYGGGNEGEASIWSRSSDIAAYKKYPGGHVIHDGDTPEDPSDDIRLGPVTFMPEDSDIGVLVEEFGHSYFDLPDLYTNDRSNSVGWWAPMSAGIWGGELGGTRPVNMPIWFKMVAECGGEPCGWADPVKAISYTTAGETIVLGQAGSPTGGPVTEAGSPFEGQTIYEGLQIDLPIQVESVENRAGEGGGAYTGPGSGRTLTLDRDLDLARIPAGDGPVLALGANWNIPRNWGYFFVEVDPDGDGEFETLPDMDGYFSDENPFGLNDGWGVTGPGPGRQTLRFDLSAWAGREALPLRLRYITYRGGPGTGVWLDDVALHVQELGQDLRMPVDDFETGLAGWRASGWQAVPFSLNHPHHYLVEWRNAEGWDRSLLGAYNTNFRDADEWRVDRVPARLPGALIMYRNTKYPFSGALDPQTADPPSWGAKYGLLVVDPNFAPVERESGGPFSGALQSLDAALSLPGLRQPDYSLELRNPITKAISATDRISGLAGPARFDDALGYAPGIRANAEGMLSAWDVDGSAVIPSRDGTLYSTRVVDPAGDPAPEYYGRSYAGFHRLGSGNPGDDNAALGLHIEVVGQAADGSWGAIRVHNAAMDYELDGSPAAELGLELPVRLGMHNRGSVEQTIAYTVTAHLRNLTLLQTDARRSLAPGARFDQPFGLRIPSGFGLEAEDAVSVRVRFDDGDRIWERSLEIPVRRPTLYLPAIWNGEG